MKTKIFKLEVDWTTEYFPGDVESILLELTEEDIEKILKHRQYIKNHSDVECVIQDSNAEFLNSEGEEDTEFRPQGPKLRIFEECVYVFAQSKYDAGTQIESEALSIDTIINAKFDEDENLQENGLRNADSVQ